MSKVQQLNRIIAYNKDLESLLVDKQLPFVRMYIGSTRPYEVQLRQATLLVTLVPLPNKVVRLIIMPSGLHKMTSISEFPEILLKQKLYQFFNQFT